ncbi:MAG: hypothetical protein NTZ36_03730 [Candidatus Jorgensenbacteria bacterium]|nr:hypothetical protein [Candidatus Jorgensenbacteria bacterium]
MREQENNLLKKSIKRANQKRSGQATLSFILLVSGLVLEIAIAGTFVTYFSSISALGERLSARAFTVASSGIRDAQMRLTRSKNFTGQFTLQLGSDSAIVNIARTSNIYTVTSVGVAGTRQRKFVATIVVDQVSGAVVTQAITEQAVQ